MHLDLLTAQLITLRTTEEYNKLIAVSTPEYNKLIVVSTPEYNKLIAVSTPSAIQVESADANNCQGSRRPQRKRCLKSESNDSVVMHTMPIFSTKNRNTFRLQLNEYFELIDLIKHQITSRFDSPAYGALVKLRTGKMTRH